MPSAISTRARIAVYAQETGEIPLMLIRLQGPELNGGVALGLVAYRNPIMSRGMLFNPYPFSVTLPEDSDERVPRAQVELDNVSAEAALWMRTITKPLKVKLEVVLLATPDTLEFASPWMDATQAIFDTQGAKIIVPLSIYPYGKIQCPHRTFNPSLFPGLF